MKELGTTQTFCQQLVDLASHNAPAHTALSVTEFLASKQITVLEHPAYSPDLAPSYFFMFPKIKEILKRRHLDELVTSGVIQWQL